MMILTNNRSPIHLLLLLFGCFNSMLCFASNLEDTCQKLESTKIHDKQTSQYSSLFDPLERAIPYEKSAKDIEYKVRFSSSVNCSQRIHASFVVSEILGRYPIDSQDFEVVLEDKEFAEKIIASAIQITSLSIDRVKLSKQLSAVVPQDLMQSVVVRLSREYLEHPYSESPWVVPIVSWGRMAEGVPLPSDVIQGLKRLDYLKSRDGLVGPIISLDSAITAAVLIHNYSLETKNDYSYLQQVMEDVYFHRCPECENRKFTAAEVQLQLNNVLVWLNSKYQVSFDEIPIFYDEWY